MQNFENFQEYQENTYDEQIMMIPLEMPSLLPLGSVVTLKEGSKRIMIIGRLQRINKLENGLIMRLSFVEGLIRSDRVFLFNQEDIRLIHFIGLQDRYEFEFRSVLEEKWKELEQEDKQ